MPLSQTPIYNLKAVLNETGLAADTLRAWERRYGVPKPQRTPGGHRLYSEHDIQLIKWLLARQADGLSISRAVEKWNELRASGEDPLANSVGGPAKSVSYASLDALRRNWLKRCLSFDESGSEQVLNEAFAVHTVETVVSELIQRGLQELGAMWAHGETSVQQEHFVSALAMRRLDTLLAMAPVPVHRETIVLACPPAELHSLPLVFLNLMLRRRSRNAILLGADVPTEYLVDTAQSVRASLVVLAAQRLTTAASLRDAASLLARKRIPVAYGGRVFNKVPGLRKQVAGEFLGEDLDTALGRVEELLARPVSAQRAGAGRRNPSAQIYIRARPEVEAALKNYLPGKVLLDADLAIANSYFGTALAAALRLGSIAYLAADMEWIAPLLVQPYLPISTPQGYLSAYAGALRQIMGTGAKEIAGWLEGYSHSV